MEISWRLIPGLNDVSRTSKWKILENNCSLNTKIRGILVWPKIWSLRKRSASSRCGSTIIWSDQHAWGNPRVGCPNSIHKKGIGQELRYRPPRSESPTHEWSPVIAQIHNCYYHFLTPPSMVQVIGPLILKKVWSRNSSIISTTSALCSSHCAWSMVTSGNNNRQ